MCERETCYPIFKAGQTLTHGDLNRLRDFLTDQDRLLGRISGFGINCGLEHAIEGDRLSIGEGLAVDQCGQPMLLDELASFSTPPGDVVDLVFDFIDRGPGGFTPVLVSKEVTTVAEECEDEGCEGHADTTCRTAEVVMVEGRLDAEPFEFDPVGALGVEPLRVRKTSSVGGSFNAVRDAIIDEVGDDLPPASLALLSDARIDNDDLPGIKALKASMLNRILFAVLDYLRCQHLMSVNCVRDSEKPGVALGWLNRVGNQWQFDCRYRHSWEPPSGQSFAFLGGACDDPCQLYLDRIEAMIDNFVVPEIPDSADPPPSDPPVKPCKPKLPATGGLYLDYWILPCDLVFPGELMPDDWFHWWEEEPVWTGPGWIDPIPDWGIYEVPRTDFLEAGHVEIYPTLGFDADSAAAGIDELATDHGIVNGVTIVTANEAQALEGYRPAGVVSYADQIVLVKDAENRVIATGAVAVNHTLNIAGSAIPGAVATSTAADVKADSAIATAEGFAGDIVAATDRLGVLEGFEAEVREWRGSVVLNDSLQAELEVALDGLNLEGMIEVAVSRSVGDVEATLIERARTDAALLVAEAEATMFRTIDEKTSGVAHELATEIKTVSVQAGEAAEGLKGLAEQTTVAQRDSFRNATRIDTALIGGKGVTKTGAFDVEMVELFTAMRSSIEASASSPQERRRVRLALERGDESLGRLREAAAAGNRLLAVEGSAFKTMVGSLVAAADAAGTPTEALENLRAAADTVMGQIE